MRRIVYLMLNQNIEALFEKCLDLCSAYTPLVEPAGPRSVFLDLTGCGAPGRIIRAISQEVLSEVNRKLMISRQPDPSGTATLKNSIGFGMEIGLATSKLLARCAVEVIDPGICPQTSWRLTTWPGIRIISVISGQEADFVATLPLNNFFPLGRDIIKRLSRLGFSRVGEMSALPGHQLRLLSAQDGGLLAQLVRGQDPSPVTGLYPPFRITYPIDLGDGDVDLIRLENLLREASRQMAVALETRHYACSSICLELIGQPQKHSLERQLSTPCSHPEHLANILLGLLKQARLAPAATGLIVTLYDLAPRPMLQPDIFSCRVNLEKDQRKTRLEELINNLSARFPDSLTSGLQPDRREQVLAYWDPWRMTGGNGVN